MRAPHSPTLSVSVTVVRIVWYRFRIEPVAQGKQMARKAGGKKESRQPHDKSSNIPSVYSDAENVFSELLDCAPEGRTLSYSTCINTSPDLGKSEYTLAAFELLGSQLCPNTEMVLLSVEYVMQPIVPYTSEHDECGGSCGLDHANTG